MGGADLCGDYPAFLLPRRFIDLHLSFYKNLSLTKYNYYMEFAWTCGLARI